MNCPIELLYTSRRLIAFELRTIDQINGRFPFPFRAFLAPLLNDLGGQKKNADVRQIQADP